MSRKLSRKFNHFAFARRLIFRLCPEKQMSLSAAKIQNGLHWTIFAALGVTALVEIFAPHFSESLAALLLVLAFLASLTALARQLPWQNVLLAAGITALIGGAAHGLSARTSIPFGPVTFNENAGEKLFESIPWIMPLLWIVAMFNSRGVARLALRPWRKTSNYGWWLIGLTAALAVGFDVALEPVAAHVNHFWLWQPTKIHATWYGASPLNFLGWAFVSLFILAFSTPSLIKKQPSGPSTPDFAPFGLWLGAIVLLGIVSAEAGLWLAVFADAVLAGTATFFAIRGAKW